MVMFLFLVYVVGRVGVMSDAVLPAVRVWDMGHEKIDSQFRE